MTATFKKLLRLERTRAMLLIQLDDIKREIEELTISEGDSLAEDEYHQYIGAVDVIKHHLSWVAGIPD